MTVERITIIAQLALSVVLLVGFFVVLGLAWVIEARVPPEQLRILDTMVGSLGTMSAAVVAFWFARQRNAVSAPEPKP